MTYENTIKGSARCPSETRTCGEDNEAKAAERVGHLLSSSVTLTVSALSFSSRLQAEQYGRVLGHWDEKVNLRDCLLVTHM